MPDPFTAHAQDFDREPRWNRPLVTPPEGGPRRPYTRCTTFVDALDEKYKLGQWQQRMVAVGLSQRKDLLLAVASLAPQLMLPSSQVPPDVREKANKLCEAALEAAHGGAGATTGTALHELTRTIDEGRELGVVPLDAQRDLDAYVAATRPLTSLYIEHPMVLDELKIGGTPDRIVELGGVSYIADLKTGSLDWGALKIAMQLAVYAHSRLYDVGANKRLATPPIDQQRAIVIHLPQGSGTCELRWVDIGRAWAAVDVARQVREWRQMRGWLKPLAYDEPLPMPGLNLSGTPEAAMQMQHELADMVTRAGSVEQLVELWGRHRDVWNDELTQLAAVRKGELQHRAAV